MADVKISGLPASTTPLAGTEVLPIVQGGQTRQVSVDNLTAGRPISASTVRATTTMGVGAATPSTSGAGITFPATQSASTDANTLDDYEEGNWTPAIAVNTGTATTYTIGTSYYTKVGRLVTVNGAITPTNGTLGSTNSYIRISGLPFLPLGLVSTGSGLNASNYNNGIAVCMAYSSNVIDAAFVTGCASNNQWSFSVTYIV